MRQLTRLVIAGLLTFLVTNACLAAHDGFTLNTEVGLSFDKTAYPVGTTAIATITISGSVEPDGDGVVTVLGGDTSTSANLPSGGTMEILLPDEPGQYTYNATISVHTNVNSNDHTSHTTISSNSVTIIVYRLTFEAAKTGIAVGGITDDVHRTTLTATVEPASMSGSVSFIFLNGTGQGINNVNASLSLSSASLTNGVAQTMLTSSNLVTTGQIQATFLDSTAEALVDFIDPDGSITINPTEIPADGESTANLTLTLTNESQNVNGHVVSWRICTIIDRADENNPVTVYDLYTLDAQGNPLDLRNQVPYSSRNYGSIATTQATSTNGMSTAVYTAGTTGCDLYIEAIDYNTYFQ